MLKPLLLRSNAFSVPAVLVLLSAPLQAQKSITIGGFVTFAGTPAEFRVNERPITCLPGTTIQRIIAEKTTEQPGCPQHILGESLTVVGQQNSSNGVITARSVESDAPGDENVQGLAVIGRVLAPLRDGILVVRVDGYPVRIDASTHVTFAPQSGLKTLADVDTNLWLKFSGVLQQDGLVHTREVEVRGNEVNKAESKLKKKSEFDAATVKEEDRQDSASKRLFGWDPKKIPAYHDDAMQARIQAIGERLVPAYQRALKADDPTKITFRFQLVDQPKVADCFALPSGIILVPYQVVQRMQNDDELAAVLASELAGVIDKQSLRALPAEYARMSASVAGLAASFFVPGMNLVTSFANSRVKSVEQIHEAEQRSREGLGLMQDAGFDVSAAPLAWWRLSAKDPKVLLGVTMPQRTQYIYQLLGTLYRARATPSAPLEGRQQKAE